MLSKKNTSFHVLPVLCFILGLLPSNLECSLQGEEVSKWANTIGDDLWKLGQAITRFSEIKLKYTFLNAKVGEKNPQHVLAEIKEDIARMIDRKMDAIRCIQEKAQELAESSEYDNETSFKYYSSKYSPIDGEDPIKLPKSLKKHKSMYLPMKLNNDTHFYNLAVNTNHSSVHVPTNVYDKAEAAAFAVQWSEGLDEVFRQNYNSDPALSWQYFGSTSGIMRHYPAKRWEEHKKDLFDCRIRTWFIEAATCTKDVIILVDNSGSMEGMGHHIASLTASSILDTLSNNDYVNVLNYSVTTNYTVPCFENMLVQATGENIRIFKEAIDNIQPDGKTALGQALEVAFNLLSFYREKRGCDGNNTSCNQAIMILTDGINGNLSETVLKYNYLNNGSNIPVRIFTYLIGKEVTNVAELKWISCANRGYYTHVQSLEQVTHSVLQYISVIARPLVLQAEEHPISWTHAYADLTYDDANDNTINEPYRLLTSVAIPCYDTKVNKMNDTRTAYLLGVAAADVPLDEFGKLTVPYKIGVNAYAFMVSNNGYVLMHPDLRPMFEAKDLKENYNSIDLSQVEQHDSEFLEPREIGETLKLLRQELVDGNEDTLHNIKIKYHYDDMKRVAEEYYDYYYSPLEYTPFTMAIAIPAQYGNYSLEVGDEIQRNQHTGENLTSFFHGRWKIHPKWTYCRYHYLEGHEFATPEEEMVHFLGKMYDRDFKWERQYEAANGEKNEFGIEKEDLAKVDCGRKTLDDDDYYCDKQLVQRLIFDARNTHEPFSEKFRFMPRELPLFQRYNASLRFVATMSGLTRWDYIFQQDTKNETKGSQRKEFGDLHPRAINEKWYKSAVLQHQYDMESFVYSVPFDAGNRNDTIVTGSYAIFPTDGGLKAPGSVVGFQFSQFNLKTRFEEVSTKLSNQCSHCGHCNKTLECYIIDHSGYIVVARTQNHTGRFFGEIEGDILESMLKHKIFKNVTIYDYQALCKKDRPGDGTSSSGASLLNPINYMEMAVNWFFYTMARLVLEFNIYNVLDPIIVFAQEVTQNDTDTSDTDTSDTDSYDYSDSMDNTDMDGDDDDDSDDDGEEEEESNLDNYFACETKLDLYVLQQDLLISHNNFTGDIVDTEYRDYYIKRIPYSNLIFVAIQNTSIAREKPIYSTAPQPITKEAVFELNLMNTTLLPCQKLDLNNMPRRRLSGCFNEHPLEHEIVDCGKGTYIQINMVIFILSFISKFYV